MSETQVGVIKHYFPKISVAVIELTEKLKVGNSIRIKGATTDFNQQINSMQIDHAGVKEAVAGQSIGLKTIEAVREGDAVFIE